MSNMDACSRVEELLTILETTTNISFSCSSSISKRRTTRFFDLHSESLSSAAPWFHWPWIWRPWRIEYWGRSIIPLKIRKHSILRLHDPELSVATCSHLFYSTSTATLLWLEMRSAQYTSATLCRALTNENTIRFLAQCVQEDVLGNQDVFTQMCTNCNSTRALRQILQKNCYCRYSSSPPRCGKWMEAQPTQYITTLATRKVLTRSQNSSDCLAGTPLKKTWEVHRSTILGGSCTSKPMIVYLNKNSFVT